jgi:hypothetical protein
VEWQLKKKETKAQLQAVGEERMFGMSVAAF